MAFSRRTARTRNSHKKTKAAKTCMTVWVYYIVLNYLLGVTGCCVLGSRCSDRAADDLVAERTHRRLQQAVHAARHQHHDQEAGEAEAGRLLVHGPARPAHLAVYRAVVRRRQLRAVHREPLQSVRVAHRGQREWPELHQRLHDAQQSLVFTRGLYASGLRHFTEVMMTMMIYMMMMMIVMMMIIIAPLGPKIQRLWL